MVVTLDNGQSITIYEQQGNLIKQLKPYIDKEIYELLDEKYGVIEQPLSSSNIRIVIDSEEMIGETIKYSNLNNGDLDNIIIATNEGGLLIASIDGGDEFECASANCIRNEEQLKYKIFADSDVRNELLQNNIINKEYIERLNMKEK